MNYYEHHIGDYAAATAHLSLVEDAVYSRMLRRYYLQESPLPADWRQVARLVGARSDDELGAVKAVLAEFFTMADDGYRQKRADEAIALFHAKQEGKSEERDNEAERTRRYRERRASLFEQLREVGVVPAFDTPMDELVRMLSHGTGRGQDGDGTATQAPVPSNQTPVEQKKRADAPANGGRLPQGWTLPADLREWAKAERPELDPDAEAAKFADHWRAQPGAKGRKADWAATWRNWIRNAYAPRAGPVPAKPSAAANFRGKTYAATPIDQLPPDLRAAAERAMRDG